MAACTCCQLVTVLININASRAVQINYSAPGSKLSRVSHCTAEWVNSDVGATLEHAIADGIGSGLICESQKAHCHVNYVCGNDCNCFLSNCTKGKCTVASHWIRLKQYLGVIFPHSCYLNALKSLFFTLRVTLWFWFHVLQTLLLRLY